MKYFFDPCEMPLLKWSEEFVTNKNKHAVHSTLPGASLHYFDHNDEQYKSKSCKIITFSQRSSKIPRLFTCYDQKALKVHNVIFLYIIVYLLEFNLANSKSSSKEQDKNVISFT